MKTGFTMKVLSLAVLGLAGLGFGASAMAQGCPATPEQPTGPWSAKSVGGGTSALSIVSPGYNSTNCKLQMKLGNSGAARAQVQDNTPANETSFRARFYFDASALSGAGGTNQAFVFLANAPAAYQSLLSLVRVQYSGSGGGVKRVNIIAACDNGSTFLCIGQANLPTPAGVNRIELDLKVGASGTGNLRYWVTDGATASTDAAPTGTIAITGGNAGWTGVDTVFLGLTSPTTAYRAVNTDVNAWVDEYDSRRTTFIGQ